LSLIAAGPREKNGPSGVGRRKGRDGGGGNRTRVPRSPRRRVYVRIREFSSTAGRLTTNFPRSGRLVSRPPRRRRECADQPAVGRLSTARRRSRRRRHGLIRPRERSCYSQLSFARCLTRPPGHLGTRRRLGMIRSIPPGRGPAPRDRFSSFRGPSWANPLSRRLLPREPRFAQERMALPAPLPAGPTWAEALLIAFRWRSDLPPLPHPSCRCRRSGEAGTSAIFKERDEMTERKQRCLRFAERLTHSLRKGFSGMQGKIR
jgi:hypothetical protein